MEEYEDLNEYSQDEISESTFDEKKYDSNVDDEILGIEEFVKQALDNNMCKRDIEQIILKKYYETKGSNEEMALFFAVADSLRDIDQTKKLAHKARRNAIIVIMSGILSLLLGIVPIIAFGFDIGCVVISGFGLWVLSKRGPKTRASANHYNFILWVKNYINEQDKIRTVQSTQ